MKHTITLHRVTTEVIEVEIEAKTIKAAIQKAEKTAFAENAFETNKPEVNSIDYYVWTEQRNRMPEILITVDGGIIDEIISTTRNIKVSVIDDDDEGRSPGESKIPYFQAQPDSIVTFDHIKAMLEEAEDEQLNEQDEE